MTDWEAFDEWAMRKTAEDLDARAFEYPCWDAWQAAIAHERANPQPKIHPAFADWAKEDPERFGLPVK